MNIRDIIKKEEYSFLKNNPLLKQIIFLTFGGSIAYGTNVPTSDVDIRGVCFESEDSLLGFNKFEVFENRETDTNIYSFNKYLDLLIKGNPTAIEMLGCKQEHYIITPEYKPCFDDLKENKSLFLSKNIVKTFGGYANQQLRRLQNAIARDSYPQIEKEKHMLKTMEYMYDSFQEKYNSFDNNSVVLKMRPSNKEDLEEEIFMDIALKEYPLRDFMNIYSELNNVITSYNKLGNRNRKKGANGLNKHAMHLIRLYLMVIDILETKTIVTYREKDLELLRGIRNGKYLKEDGTYDSTFFDLLNDIEQKFLYAKDNTDLPEKPNMEKLNDFKIEMNKAALIFDKMDFFKPSFM